MYLQNNEHVMNGYRVYRLWLQIRQTKQLTELTPSNITLNYTDTAGDTALGVYKYAVKAVYTNNVMSTAFSNELHKGMMGDLPNSHRIWNRPSHRRRYHHCR